ncbi:hypothetical protein [Parvibaculum sedimenti]|nr:hypothetical protein [Parvibaculum sedimenti]
MSKFIATASKSTARYWLKDVAALASIGGFVWVAGTWAQIAHGFMAG